MKKRILILLLMLALSFSCISFARDVMSDTWTFVDDLGRATPMHDEVGNLTDREVGMFYFVCQTGDDGTLYDTTRQFRQSGVAKVLEDIPEAGSPHFWNESYFGYYRTGDPWVIRKHMQMLTDAGVDFIFVDVSNGLLYEEDVTVILDTMLEIIKEGGDVPRVCFLLSDMADLCAKSSETLYETFYSNAKYSALWYIWDNKPLILADMSEADSALQEYFTHRRSWAFNSWAREGNGRWPWIVETPQVRGKSHTGVVEQTAVAAGFHANANKGRSFHDGYQPDNGAQDFGYSLGTSGLGLCYQEQWDNALANKTQVVMITGWNEWHAMVQEGAFADWICNTWYSGMEFPYYYVDCFSNEYSRDLEPCRNDFKDNYYWQTVINIRKFKGARAVPTASGEVTIHPAGDISGWGSVAPEYLDDLGDVTHRDHRMFSAIDPDREQDDFYYEKNGLGYYRNTTGRNDIDTVKVARDDTYVYFYVKCREDITRPDGSNWLTLFINTDGNYENGWQGYDFMVNRKVDAQNLTGYVERSAGGWAWNYEGEVDLHLDGQYLTMAVPREMLRLTENKTYTLDFKWADNLPYTENTCDPMWFYDMGDTAPNERFNYRYTASFSGMHHIPVDMPVISLDTEKYPNPAAYIKNWLGVADVKFTTALKRGSIASDGTYTAHDVLGLTYDRLNYVGFGSDGAVAYRGTVIINTKEKANMIYTKALKQQKLMVDQDAMTAVLTVAYDDPIWNLAFENKTTGEVLIDGVAVNGKNTFSFFNQKKPAELCYVKDGKTLTYALTVQKETAPEQQKDTSVMLVGDTLPSESALWTHTQADPLSVGAIASLNDVTALTTNPDGHCVFGLKKPYNTYPYVFKYRVYDAAVDTGRMLDIAYTNIRSSLNDQFITDFAGIWFGVLGDKMYLLRSNSSFVAASDYSIAQLPAGINACNNFVDVHVLDNKTEIIISVLDAKGKEYPLFTIYNIGASNYTYKNNVTGETGVAYVKENSIKTEGYMSFFHHGGCEYYWRNLSIGPKFTPIPLEMKSLTFVDGTTFGEIPGYVTIDNEARTVEAVFNEDAVLTKVWAVPVMSIDGFRTMLGGKNTASMTHNLSGSSYKLLAIGGGATMNYTVNIVRQNAPKIAFINAESTAKLDAANNKITVIFPAEVTPVDLKLVLPEKGSVTIDGRDAKFNVFDLRDTQKTYTVAYTVGEKTNTYTMEVVRMAAPGKASNTVNILSGENLPGENDLWAMTQGANDVTISAAFGSNAIAPKRDFNWVMATKETVAKEFIFEYDVAMHAENYGLHHMAFTNIRSETNWHYITTFSGIWFGIIQDRMYLLTAPRDANGQYLSEIAYNFATIPNAKNANDGYVRVRVVDRGESISLYAQNAAGKFVEMFYIDNIGSTSFNYRNIINGVEGVGFSKGNSIVSPGYLGFFHHGQSEWFIKDLCYYSSANEDVENELLSVTLTDEKTGEIVSAGYEINSTVKPFTAKVYVPEGIDVSQLKFEAQGSMAGAEISGNGTVMNFNSAQNVTYTAAGETMTYTVSVDPMPVSGLDAPNENLKVKAENLTGRAFEAPMMIAYYDEEGRLLSCEVGSYSIKASVSAVAVDIQRWRPEGAKSAKLMILSDEIGSIAPITHSVEF